MVRESCDWIDDTERGCRHRSSESHDSDCPHPDCSQRRRLPLFCAIGPFRDLGLELLLPAFSFSIVANIHDVYGVASREP